MRGDRGATPLSLPCGKTAQRQAWNTACRLERHPTRLARRIQRTLARRVDRPASRAAARRGPSLAGSKEPVCSVPSGFINIQHQLKVSLYPKLIKTQIPLATEI